jgi:hypothetical protein
LWQWLHQGRQTIDGVKIDVQGMETHVLKGMRKILSEQKPKLIVEVHSGVDRDEFREVIRSCGYPGRAVPIEPVDGEVEGRLLDDKMYFFPVS